MFQVSALPREEFADLFALDDAALGRRRARRMPAPPGSPCRVSLIDARPGETVVLVNHTHQPADTPFRGSHAIYVRETAERALPLPGEMPPALASRTLSLRGFDDAGMLVAADLAEGRAAAETIERLLADPAIAFLHAHYARFGCYAARIDRV